jgi:hypothetical protein
VAVHAENALRRPRISQVLNLPLAIAALEASGTEGLITSQYGKVLNLVSAITAAVGAIVAY